MNQFLYFRSFRLCAVLISVIIISASSCLTAIPELPWDEHKVSDITIRVRPASRESLENRYGRPPAAVNPLLDYPSIIPPRRLMVFDVYIESETAEVELVTRQTTLVFRNPNSRIPIIFSPETRAMDADELEDAWRDYYEIDRTGDIPMLVNRARDALPGNLIAKPGKPAEGYLVFLRRFPKSGTARLNLALRTPDGDRGTVEMDIVIPDTRKNNTGIFGGRENQEKPEGTGEESNEDTGIFAD